jgi:hypothetical protein
VNTKSEITIEKHRAHPDISVDRYVKSKMVALGRALGGRAAVYLDTKFWIVLRKVAMGVSTDAAELEFLRLLRSRVAQEKVFCPISESIFLELMKQADAKTRLETARLIDELSLGVTLTPHPTRVATELAHFIYLFEHPADSFYPLQHPAWSKLSYVLGYLHPSSTAFDAETELAVQKAFFDHMWTIPLVEMVGMIGDATPPEMVDFADLAATLNEGNVRHAGELRSFAQAYDAELRGAIDVCADSVLDLLFELNQKKTGEPPPLPDSPHWREAQRQWKNLLYWAMKKRRQTRDQLRTIHIEASLHAALRWDKSRRFEANDFYDFPHASAALAYCRAFFTEHGLRTMIASGHLALDKLYGCRVVSQVREATEYLQTFDTALQRNSAA